MTNEELVMRLEEDISWLEQGCDTERETCDHIKQAIEIITQHKKTDNPWKAGHPSECMWVLIRLENGKYGFDYWEGNRWKNHDPERFVTPRVVAWCDYVDPCKDAH